MEIERLTDLEMGTPASIEIGVENLGRHSILIGANGSDSREEGSGLACWSPSPTGEPSSTVSMEDYRSLSRLGLSIENY